MPSDMRYCLTILAKGDGGLWEIVPLLIFVAISVIGSLIKKAGKERELRSQEEEEARRSKPANRKALSPSEVPQRKVRTPRQTPAPAAQRRGSPLSLLGAQKPPRKIPPRPAPQPQTLRPEQVAQAQQQHVDQESRKRNRRLAARKSPEADSQAITDRLVSIHPSAAPMMVQEDREPTAFQIALNDPDSLRAAIIYHEIFSPPKALRSGGEPWES
jgi:hypothetical protein